MNDTAPFRAGIAHIRTVIVEQLQAAGILAPEVNVLAADDDEMPHQIIFNVYANGRARSMTVTQTKVIESSTAVSDVELQREVRDLVRQLA